ncbi:MAG TPA: hypothetical protein VMK66_12935 [Myxococcales bacterium]|nr:hypothetical protein [Myxococcales bacterium]
MTPLLHWGDALLKLELLRPRGSVSDRAPAPAGPSELSANQALSFAGPGAEIALRGAVTHEMRKALEIWGARIVERGAPWHPDPAVFEQTLGAELLDQLAEEPELIVGPAGEAEALLGAAAALRKKWPAVRTVALVAADVELPDLPRSPDLPAAVERVAVSKAQAAQARARLGRELGLLASHAGAAAADYAREHGGVALVTSAGEREFSLEGR